MDELLSLFSDSVDDHALNTSTAASDHGNQSRYEISQLLSGTSSASSVSVVSIAPLKRSGERVSGNRVPGNLQNEHQTTKNAAVSVSSSSSSAVLDSSRTNTTHQTIPHISASCDPITGLRIVSRRTPCASMVDAFSSFNYRTCSILAASSHAEWSREYLVDNGQPRINFGDILSGKTNVATCGILTKDTSSCLSSKTGRAFATLTLGDLPSMTPSQSSNEVHASITVFLFGEALSVMHADVKQYLRPGWAVAILGPNLMPPRKNDATKNSDANITSVSLSVNDPRQILPIGRCVDCDRCKGTIRKRILTNGVPRGWEDVRCCTLIDTRNSGYCQIHRKQGLSSVRNISINKKENSSSVNFYRRGAEGKSLSFRNDTVMKNGAGISTQGLGGNISTTGFLGSHDPILSLKASSGLKRAPLHIKKLPTGTNILANAIDSRADILQKSGKLGTVTNPSASAMNPLKKRSLHDILGEALDTKRAQSGISRNKPPRLKVFNTDAGYDGSVQVPKPNATLFRHNISASNSHSSHAISSLSKDTKTFTSILEKQRQLAEVLKGSDKVTDYSAVNAKIGNGHVDKRSISRSNVPSLETKVKIVETSGDVTKFSLVFPNINPSASEQLSSNYETILNAKSRFALAANAEEYVRARSVMQALEAKEDAGERMKSRKSQLSTKSIVTTGWACRTCNKVTAFKPVSCVYAKHDVRQRRELKGSDSKSIGSQKNRLDMHGRDKESGGLTLGSGIEWSGLRGGFG